MNNLNQNNLLEYLDSLELESICSDHIRYKGWNDWNPKFEPELIKLGQIHQGDSNSVGEYWGKKATIILTDYPYSNCEIHKCPKCNALFFFYNEDGGHATQKRYRLIQKELIDIESIIPTGRCRIEYVAYEYSIDKKIDKSFDLTICKPIGVGIDILHTLTIQEIQKYKKEGIKALELRIKDMNENYNDYKVSSWR